jgi:mannosyltransferase OCH1-like enzyme
MLALRQSGAFGAAGASIDPQVQARIPRQIMQYWDQRHPPRDIADLMRTWVETHPGYQYCRFDDTAAREYLTTHFPEAVLNAYQCASHPAQKSDLFRLAYLFREGGWYVDADDRCVGNLSAISRPNAELNVYQEQYATLGNNFLGCIPGEPVIERALTLAVETVNRGDSDAIWLATGPGLLTRAFAEVLVEQGAAWRDWLQARCILERSELSNVSWPHSISRYKDTRRGWLRSVFRSRTAGRTSPRSHD